MSVRGIAERAGVNHGLVHHYFGSKGGLIRAVLERLSEGSESAIRERGLDAVLDATDNRVRLHVQVIVRVLMEGAVPPGYEVRFPAVDYLRRMARETLGHVDETARLRAAQTAALAAGWILFEPWLLASGEFTPQEAMRAREELEPAVMRLAAG